MSATRPVVLASAGIGVVAVTFGMARYGFGLLAPDIRAAFGLSSATLGLLSAGSYVTYLLSSGAAGALSDRLGARVLIAAGGVCAVAGMVVAGLAPSAPVLFAGLLVAGASAGLVFPPFSDVVVGAVAEGRRGRVLSAISSGTGWGVALAALVCVVAGLDWRTAWLLFALLAAVATVWALAVVPARPGAGARPAGGVVLRPAWFVCPRSGPLLAGALVVGVASSVYWTFAVDHLTRDGGLSATQGRLVLVVVGVASVAGTAGGDLVRRLGARATFVLALAAEAAALVLAGVVPGQIGAAAASAALFGGAYNAAVAVEVIWSAHVFAQRPSAGLSAVMIMNGVGLLAGPPVLGAVADHAGFGAVFVGAAALLVAATAFAPRERLA